VLDGPLQGWLHLHLAERSDGEVQVFQGFGSVVRVVLQQQLGQLQPCQCELWAEAELLANIQGSPPAMSSVTRYGMPSP